MAASRQRFGNTAGIAIGPILFVLAILAILTAVLSVGSSDFGSASVTDRIAADVASQANLIRTKINECNLKYGTDQNFDGFPSSLDGNGNPTPTFVSALVCNGDVAVGLAGNLWSGARQTTLPQPTKGFDFWRYLNTNATGLLGSATGGRCIWIIPTVSSQSGNAGLVNGLTKAASKFTHQTTCSDAATCAATEVLYDPASSSQKFTVWISPPTGAPDSNCLP